MTTEGEVFLRSFFRGRLAILLRSHKSFRIYYDSLFQKFHLSGLKCLAGFAQGLLKGNQIHFLLENESGKIPALVFGSR